MATLTVGISKQYGSIAAAVAASRDGDVVLVDAGIYVDDLATVRTKITLAAVGGKAVLMSSHPLASGKALLTVAVDATVDGFVLSGAAAADKTAAGLLVTGGAVVVKNSLFTANQTGLAATGTGSVTVLASEFAANGAGDGFSGNLVVGAIASLTVKDSFIHDAVGGDEVKSSAKATTITGSRIVDSTTGAASTAAASVNLPKAGTVAITATTIEKAVGSTGPAVRLGGDATYANSSVLISGDTLVADKPAAVVVQNTTTAVAQVTGNQIYGFATVATGLATVTANAVPAARPAVSAAPLVVASYVLPVEYGRAGAVAANGTVLTVGGTGRFATLAEALAVAKDGDTVRVAAGTYADAGVTVARKVIIEGSGGIARFVGTGAPANGVAQILATADLTLRNVEVTGASLLGGVAAGVRSSGGGNVTLVNSYVHDNGAGVVADAGGTIGIYDSELARNGTADGRGANLDVAEVGTLTLRNDYVHDALGGAEIRSGADNTVVDASRVVQSAGSGVSAIDLPNSGRAAITGTAVQKKAGSIGGALIHAGGGTTYGGSSVSVSGSTLISDVSTGATRFVVAETGAGPLAVTGTAFEGGAAGSTQVVNGTNSGGTVLTGMSVNVAAPWAAAGAPAAASLIVATPILPTAQRGIMVLRVSEDAYRGHAQFTVSVDGKQVGGTLTAAASHAAGQSQGLTIAGDFAPGPHAVAVTLLNDLSAGPGQDRNLYVDGLGFNGEDAHASASLLTNGTALLTTGPIARSTNVTVNLSEDAWKGDAQAFIAVDGKLLGDIATVTASHALGKTQALSFLLDLSPGGHTVSVAYLNDAKGSTAAEDRNLYVDSVEVAGTRYAAAAAKLATNGSSNFAFTVDAPAAANSNLFLTLGAPQALSSMIPLG